MTTLECQVLEALRLELSLKEVATTDVGVYNRGRDRFGSSWAGGLKQGKSYRYCPVISLTLGKLQKQGLVTSTASEAPYKSWRLSEAGWQFTQGMASHD